MRKQQPAPDAFTGDVEGTEPGKRYANPDVERVIIGRIIARTGPGSLQNDIARTADPNSGASDVNRRSTRHDHRFQTHRLRLRS